MRMPMSVAHASAVEPSSANTEDASSAPSAVTSDAAIDACSAGVALKSSSAAAKDARLALGMASPRKADAATQAAAEPSAVAAAKAALLGKREGIATASTANQAEVIPVMSPPCTAPARAPTAADYTVLSRSADGIRLHHPQLGELEVMAGQDPTSFVEKRLKRLSGAVNRQLEYYFGDVNWAKDEHLRGIVDEDGWAPISEVLTFERLSHLTTDVAFIGSCIIGSAMLEASPCGTKIRRRQR